MRILPLFFVLLAAASANTFGFKGTILTGAALDDHGHAPATILGEISITEPLIDVLPADPLTDLSFTTGSLWFTLGSTFYQDTAISARVLQSPGFTQITAESFDPVTPFTLIFNLFAAGGSELNVAFPLGKNGLGTEGLGVLLTQYAPGVLQPPRVPDETPLLAAVSVLLALFLVAHARGAKRSTRDLV